MHGERQPAADRAELYLRSLLPEGYCQQQASTLDRLAGLVERGVVGERHVQVCGRQVPASPTEARTAVGEQIVGRLSAFREWAAINDCSLAPAMELREVDDSISGAHYRALRLPAVLLAEFRDGELRCVTPHRDGEALRTVGDRLGELEAGEPTTLEPLDIGRFAAFPGDFDTEETEDGGTDERDTDDPLPLLQQ